MGLGGVIVHQFVAPVKVMLPLRRQALGAYLSPPSKRVLRFSWICAMCSKRAVPSAISLEKSRRLCRSHAKISTDCVSVSCRWVKRSRRSSIVMLHLQQRYFQPTFLRLIRGRAGRRSGDRLTYLRRQPKAHIFRHHFQFLQVVESLVAQEYHSFFDEALRGRSAGRQSYRLHALQ